MESEPSPKRRRLVTACSECQRRKQKCDRERPCNNCTARKVSNRCHYEHTATTTHVTTSHRTPASSTEESLQPTQNNPSSLSTDTELTCDLGYSLAEGSNAFVGLQQLLEDEGEFDKIASAHNSIVSQARTHEGLKALLAHLPSDQTIDEMIKVYFSHFNWQYGFLEEYYFNSIFLHWRARTPSPIEYLEGKELEAELRFFPALLFQVLALATQVVPPDAPFFNRLSKAQIRSAQKFSDIGFEFLSSPVKQGFSLTAVQAYLLRTSWLKNTGRGIDSWHCLGNAIRQAQELGLYRSKDIHQQQSADVEKLLSLIWYEDYKRRVWANLFAFDGLMGIILGRPRMINLDDCEFKIPVDCNIPKNPSKVIPMTVSSDGSQDGPSSVSPTLFRYELARYVHQMRMLKADRPHPKDYSVVQSLHDNVVSLMENLPPVLRHQNPDLSWDSKYPHLQQQREDILTLGNLVIMSLHRAHIVSHAESRKAALQAAMATLKSQQRTFDQTPKHLYKLFGLLFYTIDAAILLCIITGMNLPHQEGVKQKIEHTLVQSLERLSVMQNASPMAKAGVEIIQRCYEKLKKACEAATRAAKANTSTSIVHLPSPPELDFMSDLGSHFSSLPQDYSSIPDGTSDFDLAATDSLFDVSAALNNFDTSFWLDQMGQIPFTPSSSFDRDLIWDNLVV